MAEIMVPGLHKRILFQHMKTIELTRNTIDLKQFIKRTALESDFQTLIKQDCIITENGVPRILYLKLGSESRIVREVCKKIKYQANTRTAGLKTLSAIFGFSPRNTIRRDFCSGTGLAMHKQNYNAVICDFGIVLSKLYEQYFPKVFAEHSKVTNEKISKDWRIKDTPFTSGIINKNNPLKYHFDGGNIKDVLSNMIVFKEGIEGGYLACPEFNIGFEVADNTVILFDGQNILHGVTPIKKKQRESYRYSIVYYTLKQMWNCLPLTEEIARIRKVHLQKERKRASGLTTAKDLLFDVAKSRLLTETKQKHAI